MLRVVSVLRFTEVLPVFLICFNMLLTPGLLTCIALIITYGSLIWYAFNSVAVKQLVVGFLLRVAGPHSVSIQHSLSIYRESTTALDRVVCYRKHLLWGNQNASSRCLALNTIAWNNTQDCVHLHVHVHVNVHVYICVYVCTCMCECMHIHTHTHIYIYIPVYTYIYIYTHINICIFIQMCVLVLYRDDKD